MAADLGAGYLTKASNWLGTVWLTGMEKVCKTHSKSRLHLTLLAMKSKLARSVLQLHLILGEVPLKTRALQFLHDRARRAQYSHQAIAYEIIR